MRARPWEKARMAAFAAMTGFGSAKDNKEQKFFAELFYKKATASFLNWNLVELWGIEPQTSSLRTTRSTN